MKKYMMICLTLSAVLLGTSSISQACDFCGADKTALISETESLVEQIAFLNDEYQTIKLETVSEHDLQVLTAFYQGKKQILINSAIDKVNQLN